MARTVDEIMNHELVGARVGERPERMRDIILALGITALPVLDDEQRPTGVVSLRDLVASDLPRPRVSAPAATIPPTATIQEAARLVAETGYHHLVVVDAERRAIGLVSCMDLLRALVGAPARHPATFPHYDRRLGVEWTDDTELTSKGVGVAPEGPGVLVLVHGGPGMQETPVWVEASEHVRARLEEILKPPPTPGSSPPYLARLLERSWLRFRAAALADAEKRMRVLIALRAQIDAHGTPEAAVT
jgi:CBS domain-containing protein